MNLFWAELMGQGIVDEPFDFDMARQDPQNPPPAPWTVQPSHPELLDELAAEFRAHNHDLRWLIRTIVSSRAYQFSAKAPPGWKSTYESHFARRITRRMTAEQTWDAVAQTAGLPQVFKIAGTDKTASRIIQTRSPGDVDKTDKGLYRTLQTFGGCDRYAI